MTLPFDEPRCRGTACADRHTCLRFLQLDTRGPFTRFGDFWREKGCGVKIEAPVNPHTARSRKRRANKAFKKRENERMRKRYAERYWKEPEFRQAERMRKRK